MSWSFPLVPPLLEDHRTIFPGSAIPDVLIDTAPSSQAPPFPMSVIEYHLPRLRHSRCPDRTIFPGSAIPDVLIEEMCTLVKGNSIEGSKLSEVDICWTPFANLNKDHQTMDTGTVGFVDDSRRWLVKNCPRNKDILKRIEKTKQNKDVDLISDLEQRMSDEMAFRKKCAQSRKQEEKEAAKQAAIDRENKSYDALHTRMGDLATSNDLGEGYGGSMEEVRAMEDDFM